jgi:transcription elongation GreA/GreB family factor
MMMKDWLKRINDAAEEIESILRESQEINYFDDEGNEVIQGSNIVFDASDNLEEALSMLHEAGAKIRKITPNADVDPETDYIFLPND